MMKFRECNAALKLTMKSASENEKRFVKRARLPIVNSCSSYADDQISDYESYKKKN